MPSQLNGIVAIDKPAEMSSAKVVQRVKQILNVKKVGHTGTLDPFATGVLVVCLNKATKLARFLIESDKTYNAVMELGVETDTLDVTGTVTTRYMFSKKVEDALSENRIKASMQRFVGVTQQLPPVYSALKHRGVPLYKLARQGKPIQKPAREVTISELKDIEINFPYVRFSVTCSAGTYIRALCADMGKALGCGAHLSALRRTACCGFTVADAVSLSDLETFQNKEQPKTKSEKQLSFARHIKPMAEVLTAMPTIRAHENLAGKIRCGKKISKQELAEQLNPKDSNKPSFFKVLDRHKNLIAILENEEKAHFTYCCVFDSE